MNHRDDSVPSAHVQGDEGRSIGATSEWGKNERARIVQNIVKYAY